MALSRLVTISISSFRNLDIEAYKFVDRAYQLYDAARLTQCYTQHALWPYKDSKINHIRLKLRFIAYSSSCTTTEWSTLLTSFLTAIKKNNVITYCAIVYERNGKK